VTTALGPVGKRMAEKLETSLTPSLLQVIDESHHHAGHSGSRPDGESHFRIRISSAALNGLNRVNQHRKVNEVLAEELRNRVHALAIEVVRSG
jgi:BolA family transcriptional regulator, general stress-responsive regulator